MFSDNFIYNQLKLVSACGTIWPLYIGSAVLVSAYLYRKGYMKYSILVLFTLLSYFYSLFLKGYFRLPRPGLDDLKLHTIFDEYGFPSGHTITYTVFFGILIYLSFKLNKVSKPVRRFIFWISFYFLALIGVSRVGLGMHFIRDVVGGYLFGLLFLLCLILIDKILETLSNSSGKNKK